MDLLQNPFYILAASPRDNKRRIMELADERSLLPNSTECMEARSALTNPRKRLSAEVAWLPGVASKHAGEMLATLQSSPPNLLEIDELTPIGQCNLLAAGLVRLPENNLNKLSEWILDTAWAFEDIEPEDLRVIINRDRAVSGFSEVLDYSAVEDQIQERRRYYLNVIKSALDKLFPRDLVATVTTIVEEATDNGEKPGPVLIADLVDSYEVEAQGFLQKEEENIKILVDKVRAAVVKKTSPYVVVTPDPGPLVDRLIEVVENWDAIAQPIQVAAKSRGLDHDASHRVARLVRELSVYIFNKHGQLEIAQQLTDMLQRVFEEVGEVVERITEDLDALEQNRLYDRLLYVCKTAIKNAKQNPYSEGETIAHAAPKLIADLAKLEPDDEVLSRAKDQVAFTIMYCASVYGIQSQRWDLYLWLLTEADFLN